MRKKDYLSIFILILALFILSTKEAHAYLDPGTGSYILQILIAGILGGLVAIRAFWSNIRTFVKGLFKKDKKSARKKNGK